MHRSILLAPCLLLTSLRAIQGQVLHQDLLGDTSKSLPEVHSSKITTSKLLSDLSDFAGEAFDVDFLALDLNEHRDKKTLLLLLTQISDQLDHLDTAAAYTNGSDPVKDTEDLEAAQSAVTTWETQFTWEAQDIALFTPQVAQETGLLNLSLRFAQRMQTSFEAYSATVLELVPDDGKASLRHGQKSAQKAMVALIHEFERLLATINEP